MRFISTVLAMLITLTVHAQNIFWLQGTWRGKSYLPGSDGSQYYMLVMDISQIKGNKFEGIITIMQPSDTSYRFDSKISGVVYDKYLIINRKTVLYVKDAPDIKWKVSCNNCKPPRMIFSFEEGKIIFRGEEKDCYKECNGISEFSKSMDEFDSLKKEAVYALANQLQPGTDIASQNISVDSKSTVAATSNNAAEERTLLITRGDITSLRLNNKNASSEKESTELDKKIPLTVQQNPPPRIIILPAGDIVFTKHKTTFLSQKEMVAMRKNISLTVKQNPPPRISILPAGDIVFIKHNKTTSLSQKEMVAMRRNISLMVKQNPSPRTIILPAGDIVSAKRKTIFIYKKVAHPAQRIAPALIVREPDLSAIAKTSLRDSIASAQTTKDTITQKPITIHRDSVALPVGYAERKKNVIRTLTVNTDSIVLRVYDNGVVDGDIVSVVYNDNVVIDKLSLTTRAVVVKIPVNTSQINTLVFHAHNLGEFPPNTAKLEILYGNKKEELTVSSDLTVSSTIDIVHQ